MTVYFTEEGSIEAVNSRMGQDINPRLAKVMACLVKHLHAFAKEIRLTQGEWDYGIDFLTRAGQICTAERDLRAKVGSDAPNLERARSMLGHADTRVTAAHYRRKAEVIE